MNIIFYSLTTLPLCPIYIVKTLVVADTIVLTTMTTIVVILYVPWPCVHDCISTLLTTTIQKYLGSHTVNQISTKRYWPELKQTNKHCNHRCGRPRLPSYPGKGSCCTVWLADRCAAPLARDQQSDAALTLSATPPWRDVWHNRPLRSVTKAVQDLDSCPLRDRIHNCCNEFVFRWQTNVLVHFPEQCWRSRNWASARRCSTCITTTGSLWKIRQESQ